jgi:hypothetical protein
VRAKAPRNLTNDLELGVRGTHAAGIVKVRQHDHPRARRDTPFHFARVELESHLEVARETPHFCAEILRRREQRFIRRLFHQDFVAGLEQRRHRQMVRHRSSLRVHHAIRWHAGFLSQLVDQWRIAVARRTVQLDIFDACVKFFERQRSDSAPRKIKSCARTQLRPLDVRGTNFPPLRTQRYLASARFRVMRWRGEKTVLSPNDSGGIRSEQFVPDATPYDALIDEGHEEIICE